MNNIEEVAKAGFIIYQNEQGSFIVEKKSSVNSKLKIDPIEFESFESAMVYIKNNLKQTNEWKAIIRYNKGLGIEYKNIEPIIAESRSEAIAMAYKQAELMLKDYIIEIKVQPVKNEKPNDENWKKIKKFNLNNLGIFTLIRGKKMNEEVEKWTLEDGRRVEKTTVENKEGEEIERVTEIRVDKERPLNIQKKIIEKIKPVVYERVTQSLDLDSGAIIEEKVENVNLEFQKEETNQDNSFVTKKEMIDAIVSAIKTAKTLDAVPLIAPKNDLKSLGVVSQVESSKSKFSIKNIIWSILICLQLIALAYLIIS